MNSDKWNEHEIASWFPSRHLTQKDMLTSARTKYPGTGSLEHSFLAVFVALISLTSLKPSTMPELLSRPFCRSDAASKSLEGEVKIVVSAVILWGEACTYMLNLSGKVASFFVLAMVLTLATSPRAFACVVHICGMDPNSGYWGTTVHVYGGEATPKGVVVLTLCGSGLNTIYVGNTSIPLIIATGNTTLGWTSADDSGAWDIYFRIPTVSPGNYYVYVVDNETLTSDAMKLQVLMSGVVVTPVTPFSIDQITPSSASPGAEIGVSGSGASGGGIKVYFDETLVTEVLGAHWGGWHTYFTVPQVAAGTHRIRAVETSSNAVATVAFMVTLTQPSTLPMTSLASASLPAYLLAGAVFAGIAGLVFLVLVLAARRPSRHISDRRRA